MSVDQASHSVNMVYTLIGGTLFAVEVDQHKSYDEKDQDARIHEIHNNIGIDKKMVFIRFNPDAYRKTNGTRGRTTMADRLLSLRDVFQDVLDHLSGGGDYDDVHTEIKLFYDE